MRPLRSIALAVSIALGLAGLVIAPRAVAQPVKERTEKGRAPGERGSKKREPKKSGRSAAQSVGSPNRGRLADGVRLRGTPYLAMREGGRTWGLPELVKMTKRAAASVERKHPGSKLLVGDMSARLGGPLAGHNSHQSGRDVDLGFYVTNTKGNPVPMKRFVSFEADGKSKKDVSWVRFDDARNWALVEALLKDENAGVRYVFVSHALRGRLLAYAQKKKVPADLMARASAALMSPKDVDVHDDHFHVRIRCPESSRDVCAEESSSKPSEIASAASDASDASGGAVADAKAATTAVDAAPHAAPSPETSVPRGDPVSPAEAR
jgi:penicillin-insensitive murein DD-endopeptidase